MAAITLHGNPFNTCGELPAKGAKIPEIKLTTSELGEFALSGGDRVVLNIFPSIDTPVCAASVRNFNEKAASLKDTTVLCVSMDLPFALGRFCGAEGLSNVKALSAFRNPEFGKALGVTIVDGPLAGLFARAVIILAADNTVLYTQLVPEIAQEPDYAAAVAALGS